MPSYKYFCTDIAATKGLIAVGVVKQEIETPVPAAATLDKIKEMLAKTMS